MSEAKFTKGPWIAFYPHELINSDHVSVESDDGKQICISEVYKSNLDERTANANLIAAAPEMYEMLQAVNEWHILQGEIGPFQVEIDRLLAKARGEQ